MRVNALKLLIEEVEKDLNTNHHLSALIVALTISDICGMIMFPSLKTGERYRKWFDLYIGNYEQSLKAKEDEKWSKHPYMNGKICYKLRCSLLHSGSDDIAGIININEFNLHFENSAILNSSSIEQRTDYMSNGSIEESSNNPNSNRDT